MKNHFLRKILAATHLTQHGKLADATRAIQRALSGEARAGAHTEASSTGPSMAGVGDDAMVLDGLVRDVGDTSHGADAPDAFKEEAGVAAAPLRDAEPPVVAPPGAERFLDSSFTGAAGTRSFKLFTPAGFEGRPLPLVVMLHGCTQDPDDFAAGTGINELARADGFFVLYPAQAARSNAHKCWNWFSPADQQRGAGAPALLAGMVRHVLQTHPIDPDRVYVAGLSAGGAMAAILASEYPDVFAAAGVHSGLPAGAAHDVASAFSAMKAGPAGGAARRPVAARDAPADGRPRRPSAPVIVFHGDADSTVTAANGDAVIAAALEGTPEAVAQRVDSTQARGGRGVRRTVWRESNAGANTPSIAEQWVVLGAPHAWSGGAATGSYTDPKGPDASREMVRFFRDHPRRRP